MTDKTMKDQVENEIQLDKSGVWMLADQKKFNYSDGRSSELYLKRAFTDAKDLSSTSYKLEKWIKDWPSEYHLSRKRAQLLRGFDFDRSKKVLELGCGCGAITRFLGETFDDIVAVEGSTARAKLARLRTKDMGNILILCGPFQEIKFRKCFDIIFCIGVFEYSNMFVNAEDPHDSILQYFHDVLTPDGVVVLAIENQFGLKYFSSSTEDHTNVMFDGLEGYSHYGKKARTFGYDELKERLSKYFNNIDFYFPYPDYKIPSCVVSERLFSKIKAGELVGKFLSRDYIRKRKPLFDKKLVILELDKNNKLPFFSNSFLVVVGKKNVRSVKFKQLGIMFSADRMAKLQTVTRFVEHNDGGIVIHKAPIGYHDDVQTGSLTLRACKNRWVDGLSLNAQVMKRVKERDITLEELFAPCQLWLKTLNTLMYREGDTLFLDGKYVDCIWSNSYIHDGDCVFIDHEWEWAEPIKINVIVIRAIYIFLDEISSMIDLNPILNISSRKVLISRIAKTLGIEVNKKDFMEFADLEAEIAHTVFGANRTKNRFYIKFILWNERMFTLSRNAKDSFKKALQILRRITGCFRG